MVMYTTTSDKSEIEISLIINFERSLFANHFACRGRSREDITLTEIKNIETSSFNL